jgi:PBSX family phage terminase large subunit
MDISPYSTKAATFINRNPSKDRFMTVLEGSIRSGKTWAMIPKILFQLCPYPVAGEKILFGVSKETLYNNVLNDLFNFVGPKNYSYNRQTGQMWLSGTKWRVIGAKDEGSEKYIRGATVGVTYGDELVLIPRSFVEMMLGRMSPEGARFYGTTNPDTPYHWLNKDYLTSEEKLASGFIEVIKFTLRDNTSLSKETIKRYETQFKGVFKQRMIEGMWVVAEGAIYRDCYIPELIDYDDDTRPITLANAGGFVEQFIPVDYGTTNPMVFLHIIDDGTTYWVDDEYYYDSKAELKQKTDGQYADDLVQWRDKHAPGGAQVIIDPSAASFKAEMALRGIWHGDADNDVENGIRKVASLLAQQKIRIHKRCKMLRLELQTYAWDDKSETKGLDIPLKVHDHAPDALRYFVNTKVPNWRITIPNDKAA